MLDISKKELPKIIKSITCEGQDFDYKYYIIDSDKFLKLPIEGLGVSNTINTMYDINSLRFTNGYARTLLSNGKFGYIEEKSGKLMPYSFSIAFDFNEFGLAMVGGKKLGYISKSDFECINERYVNQKLTYDILEEFTNINNINLAKVAKIDYKNGFRISFINEVGNVKNFIRILNTDETTISNQKSEFICNFDEYKSSYIWNSEGIIYNESSGDILFIEGYYSTDKNFVSYCYNSSYILSLNSFATRTNVPKQKKLNKPKNNE